jgi:hypothetical protein
MVLIHKQLPPMPKDVNASGTKHALIQTRSRAICYRQLALFITIALHVGSQNIVIGLNTCEEITGQKFKLTNLQSKNKKDVQRPMFLLYFSPTAKKVGRFNPHSVEFSQNSFC